MEENLEWKQVARRELLKTPVFLVTERHSVGPDGQEGDYIVNEARDWVIVIPEAEPDEFLMVRQWRHGEYALSIEFPGGVIDAGENPEHAARRELREETGAEAGTLVHLGTMNPNPALFSNKVHIYCASALSYTGTQKLDADEFVHYFRMKRSDVYKQMGTGEFCHALMASALGLYLAKR